MKITIVSHIIRDLDLKLVVLENVLKVAKKKSISWKRVSYEKWAISCGDSDL